MCTNWWMSTESIRRARVSPSSASAESIPTAGIYFQQTNSTWSKYVYTGLEITVSKQMSNRFQFLVGIHRQWQHQTGTWNPTDPARFIQPDAFPNDKGLWMTRGNYDHNSYEAHGLGNAYGPTWKPYTIRTAYDVAGAAGHCGGGQLRRHCRARTPARS